VEVGRQRVNRQSADRGPLCSEAAGQLAGEQPLAGGRHAGIGTHRLVGRAVDHQDEGGRAVRRHRRLMGFRR